MGFKVNFLLITKFSFTKLNERLTFSLQILFPQTHTWWKATATHT